MDDIRTIGQSSTPFASVSNWKARTSSAKNHQGLPRPIQASLSTPQDMGMDVKSFLVAQASTSLSYTSSAVFGGKTGAPSSAGSIPSNFQDMSKSIQSSLMGFASTGELSKYMSLFGSLIGNDDRMKSFLDGMTNLIQTLSDGAPSSEQQTTAEQPDGAVPQQNIGQQALMVGQSISFSFSGHMEAVYAASVDGQMQMQTVSVDVNVAVSMSQTQESNQSDPIALDMNRDGRISLTGVENGKAFDINADGKLDRTQFITGGDAFLALDSNRNGVIDNGSELFGDQNGAANGFLELARYDDNRDGKINAEDKVWQDLLLIRMNAQGDLAEQSIIDTDLKDVSLGNTDASLAYRSKTGIAQIGSYSTKDDQKGLAADMLLNYIG